MDTKLQTIIVSAQSHTQEIIKLYLEEFGTFNFLASTDDLEKAYNAAKELSKSLVIVDISENIAMELAEKVLMLYSNRDILADMGQKSYQRVSEYFSWEKTAKSYLTLFAPGDL